MAGYFTKLNGHVYEGEHKAGEELANGVFATITANGVKKLTAAGDAEFRVDEKTTLWGLPAIRMTCVYEGTKELFLVENEFEDYGDKELDWAAYTVPTGHYVKMRKPEAGDQLIISVTSEVAATLAVGDLCKPASGGSVAKKA
jgi:hypothetical protein